jgi:hypothetical protein
VWLSFVKQFIDSLSAEDQLNLAAFSVAVLYSVQCILVCMLLQSVKRIRHGDTRVQTCLWFIVHTYKYRHVASRNTVQ